MKQAKLTDVMKAFPLERVAISSDPRSIYETGLDNQMTTYLIKITNNLLAN